MNSIHVEKNTADAILSAQSQLLAQIKKSHQFFIARFYCFMFVFVSFITILIALIISDPEVSLSSYVILIIPVGFLGRILKDNLGFLKWSKEYFLQVELSQKQDQPITRLTEYVNKLYHTAFPDLMNKPETDWSIQEFYSHFSRRMRIKGILVSFLSIMLLGTLGISLYLKLIEIELLWELLTPISTIMLLIVLMITYTNMWSKSVKSWIQGFQAIEQWGQDIINDNMPITSEDSGGRELSQI